MKVLALREQFSHMGRHSGYDLLFSELEKKPSISLQSTYFRAREKYWPPKRAIYRYIKKKYVKGTPYYASVQNVAAEIRAIRQAKNSDLLHVGYLENNYGLLRNERVRRYLGNTKIIATAHQPASWWRLNGGAEMVGALDALIVLTPVEKAYFEQFLPGKVFCIPHGVDSQFFQPSEHKPKEFRCVFSGQWLRDIPNLIKVIEMVIQRKPSIGFDLIYPNQNRLNNYELYRLAKYSQVAWHSNLSDEALCRVYQNARALLLPMLDCTANNALLEGMSCGLPVVSSDLDAVRFYTHPEATFLFKTGEEQQMADRIIELSEQDANTYETLLRNHVISHFSWNTIADEVIKLYETICA